MIKDIHTAAQDGDTETIRSILKNDPGLADSFNNDGWTPLHLAAHYGNIEAARLLLEFGADVNSISNNEMANNPLHAAVAGNRAEIVALLLHYEAEVNNKQNGGWTALHGAANNGNIELIKILVAKGAEIDSESDDGTTASAIARKSNHAEIADYLEKIQQ